MTDEARIRGEFEKWAVSRNRRMDLSRFAEGDYANPFAGAMLKCWQAAYALGASEMRWIPVEERLPHTHTVLGAIVGDNKDDIYVDAVCYFPAHDSQKVFGSDLPRGEWRTNGDDEEPDKGVVVVIAWMPLPDPPVVGKETE